MNLYISNNFNINRPVASQNLEQKETKNERYEKSQNFSTRPVFTNQLPSTNQYLGFILANQNIKFGNSDKQVQKAQKVEDAKEVKTESYENNLKTMLNNNEAQIMGIVLRTFNAKDIDNDEIIEPGEKSGTFLNAIERLDEIKALGINTLHILPFHPTGKVNALGTAGSIYSPLDLLRIDPMLDDKDDPRDVKEECKEFINECHKRNIKVMLDLPSCGSYEMFLERPELMAIDRFGIAKTPQGWNDIRMFAPYDDETKGKLNPHLLQLHKDFVDMCIDLGIDGIRADVARAKPPEFWNFIIQYSHEKDPEFGWLAETYTYEDASPQLNMPADRPEDNLKVGFDTYYGQFHIFHEWDKASTLTDYIIDNLEMSYNFEPGKSMIGSFGTHDDISLMYRGGVKFSNLVSGLQATLPMVNPYIIDGFQSGDRYDYKYKDTIAASTLTDSNVYEVHTSKMDIFNLSRKPGGNNPEIGEFFSAAMKMREENKDILTGGSFIPLKVEHNPNDQIITFARCLNGRTLLVVANRNINSRETGIIDIPTLKADQKLVNLLPKDGEESRFQCEDNKLKVDLGAARIHVFEIDTKELENSGVEVYRQNLA